MITVRKRRKVLTIKRTKPPPKGEVVDANSPKPLEFETAVNNLVVQIARANGGMKYDYIKVEPHRSVRKLQEAGFVTVRKHTTRIWVVRLTEDGNKYLGKTLKRRRRRRRKHS